MDKPETPEPEITEKNIGNNSKEEIKNRQYELM